LNWVAPRTKNSMASNVLPQPALPQISVGRPLGNPPPVISSNPWMPVGDLGSWGLDLVMFISPVMPVIQSREALAAGFE
jgi:hypothetical protein